MERRRFREQRIGVARTADVQGSGPSARRRCCLHAAGRLAKAAPGAPEHTASGAPTAVYSCQLNPVRATRVSRALSSYVMRYALGYQPERGYELGCGMGTTSSECVSRYARVIMGS